MLPRFMYAQEVVLLDQREHTFLLLRNSSSLTTKDPVLVALFPTLYKSTASSHSHQCHLP